MKAAIPNTAQTQWVEMTASVKRKLPRLTPRGELDKLIDWYETHKPDMPHEMPGGVAMKPEELDKFASKVANGVWSYRGWRLTESDALPRKEKVMKISKGRKARKRRASQP